MKKELEELEKTTDLLKEFKSRVTSENDTTDINELLEEWKNNNKVKNNVKVEENNDDVDDNTLELSDLELEKTIKLENINNKSEVSGKSIEEQLNEGIKKRKIYKKCGLGLMCFSFFFVPLVLLIFIINSHSNKLLNNNILIVLSIILVGLFILGLNFYLRNPLNTKNISDKLWFRIYGYFMIAYSVIVGIIIVLFYGPSIEFKEIFVDYCTNNGKDYHTYFYSNEEINDIINKEN